MAAIPEARTCTPAPPVRDLMQSRRSIRRYRPTPVARDLLDTVLEAAVAAPSAHNRQPWRFVVVEATGTKAALADAMGARLRADRVADGDAIASIDADVARSHARLTGAPVLVVVCMTLQDMDRYPDPQRAAAEATMATQSVAMAAQNLMVCAHSLGLASCWMCAPLFCPDTVASVLGLPSDWNPQGIVTLGHPAEAGKPYRRHAPTAVVRFADRPA